MLCTKAVSVQVLLSPQASSFFFKCCTKENLPHLELIKYIQMCWSLMYDLLERTFLLKVVNSHPYSSCHYSLMIRALQSLFSLLTIVHKSPSYRRRDTLTSSSPPANGPIWTCFVEYSRYQHSSESLAVFTKPVMQHPALAQQQFSSEHMPTISHVFPTIEFLLTSLEATKKDPTFRPIHDAITAGISNLSKWYQTLNTCHVYVVSNGACVE